MSSRKIIIAFSTFVLGFGISSCTHKDESNSGPVDLYIGARLPSATKSVDDDAAINSLDIMIFREGDDNIEQYARVASDHATVQVTPGVSLRCCLIANATEGALSGYSTYSGFKQHVDSLINVPSNGLVMIKDTVMVVAHGGQEVHIDVERMPSKVTVQGISVEFMSTAIGKQKVVLDRIYMINASSAGHLDGKPVAWEKNSPFWINKLTFDDSLPADLKELTLKSLSKEVKSAAKMEDEYNFYVMPNPVDNDKNYRNCPTWEPRNTRLVIEMTIGTVKCYYPVTLPSMKPNYQYLIRNIILKGYGSEHPDAPVVRESIYFDLSVEEWGSETTEYEFDEVKK